MTTTKHYFSQETIKNYMYETHTAMYEFVRYNCDWEDDEQLFEEVFEDFKEQVEEAEALELGEMRSWDKDYMALQLRASWRKVNLLRLELNKTKELL